MRKSSNADVPNYGPGSSDAIEASIDMESSMSSSKDSTRRRWSKNNADIERIERFVVAYDYSQAKKTLDTSKDEVKAMKSDMEEKEKFAEDKTSEINEFDAAMTALKTRLEGEVGSELSAKKAEEEAAGKDLVKANSALQNADKALLSAEQDVAKAAENVADAEKNVEGKKVAIEADANKSEQIKLDAKETAEKYSALQLKYQNMSAGIASEEDASAGSLPEQISRAHEAAVAADFGKSVSKVQADMKKEEKAAATLNAKKSQCATKVDKLQKQLGSLKFSEQHESELYERKRSLETKHSNLGEKCETLEATLAGRLSFNYSDPSRGFDRSKVKGLVAKLVQVASRKDATALEVVAGGKLYQVIVDEAATGKAILAHGKLKKRVTIIPLDKISSRGVSPQAASLAANMASKMGTTATPAIELVGFDEEVRTAM
ncbi:hypothetical protein TeGR_g11636, partial [Tetraparma gracilis]